jgi:hypothetical protein
LEIVWLDRPFEGGEREDSAAGTSSAAIFLAQRRDLIVGNASHAFHPSPLRASPGNALRRLSAAKKKGKNSVKLTQL